MTIQVKGGGNLPPTFTTHTYANVDCIAYRVERMNVRRLQTNIGFI